MWQVYQPLQLIALFYPEFDHIWQMEMDIKYTSHVGEYLSALSNFAKNEPRKHSRERASYFYMPKVHGTYKNFVSTVNDTMAGGGGIWGPLRIPEVEPIGPAPPTENSQDDNFEWGKGEDADVILLSPCNIVDKLEGWTFKDWLTGFAPGRNPPRFVSPPAMKRTSGTLLRAIHTAQLEQGLAVPSEATPTTFAFWHGLKLSYPPSPWWMHPQVAERENVTWMDEFLNGGPPSLEHDAIAHGDAIYNPGDKDWVVKSSSW